MKLYKIEIKLYYKELYWKKEKVFLCCKILMRFVNNSVQILGFLWKEKLMEE